MAKRSVQSAITSGEAARSWRRKADGQAAHDFLDEVYAPRRDALLAEIDRLVTSGEVVIGFAAAGDLERASSAAAVMASVAGAMSKAAAALKSLHGIDAHNNRSATPSASAEAGLAAGAFVAFVPGDTEGYARDGA